MRSCLVTNSDHRKTVVLVGTGHRGSGMFLKPCIHELQDRVNLVAIFDPNIKRAKAALAECHAEAPIYTDFEKMMGDMDPDGVIVTSRDCTHAEYVIRALKANKHVFSEKPLCTTVAQCEAIREAHATSTGRCLVTHNRRYDIAALTIQEIIRSGQLGEVFSMHFSESLDRCHGADYFRRWHREMSQGGGLMIHKASHHFDLLNWWAGAKPKTVNANGRLAFYGKNGPYRHTRCSGCPHANVCAFYLDLSLSERYTKMYSETESEDGYMRDGCVFDPSIDIYDQMSVLIEYENDIQVDYSLIAYSPYESERVIIEGSKGRLEYTSLIDTGWLTGGQALPGIEQMASEHMTLYIAGKGTEKVPLNRGAGNHGGADPQLRSDFFRRDWTLEPTDQMASVEDAIQAVLVGTAANTSIQTGAPVDVQNQSSEENV